jgi:uncharacterized protein (TIGR02646 family)
MIPVVAQPEPPSFDAKVRQKGRAWMQANHFDPAQPFPPKTKIKPYWTDCLSDLHTAYSGICAYMCVYIDKVTGAKTVDHFAAKSKATAQEAYEWQNYRLVCALMNSRKNDFSDVLDPFQMSDSTFTLDLLSGRIAANPQHQDAVLAEQAIKRLNLNHSECCELRVQWFQDYFAKRIASDYLKQKSPFVWQEAERQGLL